MKKIVVTAAAVLLLCGCTAQETFETVADEPVIPVMAQPREIEVHLPDNAIAPVLGTDSAQIYLSSDYEIVVETLSSGDIHATVQAISGYEAEKLTVLKTRQGDADRYEFVWACAGETGDRLGRAVVLDDGQFHYCMSVLRDAEDTGESQIVWSEVFDSFALSQGIAE